METHDPSIGDLVAQLTQQASTLIRQEIALAQAEMQQNAANIQRDIALVIAGAAVIFAGFTALLTTGIIALAQILPWWQAGLIGGGGSALVGLIVLIIGQVALRRARLIPRRSLSALVAPVKEAAS
jgi:uncharacterized membrane protein YqjE